jgi:diguanylate cyclase (GGDEF)-like protein
MNKELSATTNVLYILEGLDAKVHSSFMECIEKFEATDAKGRHYSIIMFDVDYFKAINDLFGHNQGDSVLRELTRMVDYYQREERELVGIFGKHGGEEFLLALPYCTSKQARYIADEIRELVQQHMFYNVQEKTFSLKDFITISMGIDSVDLCDFVDKCIRGDKIDEISLGKGLVRLKSRADSALSYAKFLGRNRVEIFGHYLESEMRNLNVVRNFFFCYSHKKPSELRGLFEDRTFVRHPDIARKLSRYFYIIRTEINPRDTRTQAVFADNFYRCFMASNSLKKSLSSTLRKKL